jgi:hypothetical protein
MLCFLLHAFLIVASSIAFAQDKPKGVEEFNEFNAKPLEGWEWDDDERLPDLVMQLQQKELTLQAIDAKIAKATGKKASSKMAGNMAWRSTQRMDLNGGGPVRWDAFYGRNAENFFYHPKDPNTSYHTNTVLQQVAPTSANGVAGNQGVPAHQRPPQFDYIYRGYENAQARASEQARDLADKLDEMKSRRRELEGEVVVLWMKLAFRVIDRDRLPEKPRLRYAFRPKAAGNDDASEQALALTSAAQFLATAMLFNENLAEESPDQAFSGVSKVLKENRKAFEDGFLRVKSLHETADDKTKPLGQFKFLSRKLEDTAKSLSEGFKGWKDGDANDDEPTKFDGLKRIQDGVVRYSKILLALNELVVQMENAFEVDLNTDSNEFTPRWDMTYVPPKPSVPTTAVEQPTGFTPVRITYHYAADGKTTTTVNRLADMRNDGVLVSKVKVRPGVWRATYDFRDKSSLDKLRSPLLRLIGVAFDSTHHALHFDAKQLSGMSYPDRFRLPATLEVDVVADADRSALQIGIPDNTPPSQPFVTISTGDGFRTVDIVDRWTVAVAPNASQPETKEVASVLDASTDREVTCNGIAPISLDPKDIYRLGVGVFPGQDSQNAGFFLHRLSLECRLVPSLGVFLKEGDAVIVDRVAESSLAERGGLLKGDRLLAVNGVRPANTTQALALLATTDYGEKWRLEYERDGKRRSVEILAE